MKDSDSGEISSILSKKQRKWLKGDDEVLASPERVVRSRIKKRVRQSIRDLALISNNERDLSSDLKGAIRNETTSSNDEVATAIMEQGQINEEILEEYWEALFFHLEMSSGKDKGEFDIVEDFIKKIGQLNNQGYIDNEGEEEIVLISAVGALIAMDKTDKQIRQWIENNWPSSEQALENKDKALAKLNQTFE